jgi:putative endonuclease
MTSFGESGSIGPEPCTSKYGVKMLVWYEQHETRESPLIRERQIKNWNRSWKLQLIEQMNSGWRDLWHDISV